jgi:hypothetical protein
MQTPVEPKVPRLTISEKNSRDSASRYNGLSRYLLFLFANLEMRSLIAGRRTGTAITLRQFLMKPTYKQKLCFPRFSPRFHRRPLVLIRAVR